MYIWHDVQEKAFWLLRVNRTCLLGELPSKMTLLGGGGWQSWLSRGSISAVVTIDDDQFVADWRSRYNLNIENIGR